MIYRRGSCCLFSERDAKHFEEPLRAEIIFSDGFDDFCVSSPLHLRLF